MRRTTLLGSTTRRARRLLIGLAVAASLAVAMGGPLAAHAAGKGIICAVCPPAPTLAVSAVQYSATGTPTVTFSGQNYTPGGQVEIVLWLRPLGALTLATTTATLPAYWCILQNSCIQVLAGGTIYVSASPTLVPGGPVMCGPYQAWDARTGLWSNTVRLC